MEAADFSRRATSRSKAADLISTTEACTAEDGRTVKLTDTASVLVSRARENIPVRGITASRSPVSTLGLGNFFPPSCAMTLSCL